MMASNDSENSPPQDAQPDADILTKSASSSSLKCPIRTDIYSGRADIIDDSLPLIIHDNDAAHTVQEVAKGYVASFLQRDLDVSRLNAIHDHMWACGRPMNARALHRQQMMKRQLVLTEQADLHLLYDGTTLFIKPLPAYLLSPAIWQQHFISNEVLHQQACGFLLSYIWLLRSPLDFSIAEREKLLPPRLNWAFWRLLVREFLVHVNPNSLHQVNKRYHYGELRLHRINSAYRMIPRLARKNFVRGYLYGYNRYNAFFQRSFGWVLIVFVWFSLILSAMQAGASVPQLNRPKTEAFDNACFGFVVFSILLVAALFTFIGGLFLGIFVFNMFAAIIHTRRQRKRRLGFEVASKHATA